jgi:GDP-L-fucose synthase
MSNETILVTGASGMIGKALQRVMPGTYYVYHNYIINDDSADKYYYDLTDEDSVCEMYDKIKPGIVVHLAARVSGIQDNLKHPADHYDDNILMNTLVLKYAREFGVKNFIGMGSTCMYPDVASSYPLHESQLHDGPPAPSNFAYAYAKRCMAVQIEAYNQQYGTNYSYLMPCNVYGIGDKYNDDRSHFVGALIKKIYTAKKEGHPNIVLFGTGKPLRQFIYCDDVAKIINHCIENDIYINMNVACDEVYSIYEIARIGLKACDAGHLTISYDPTKPDGQYRKDASNDLLKKVIAGIGFTRLADGIKIAYDDYCKQMIKPH